MRSRSKGARSAWWILFGLVTVVATSVGVGEPVRGSTSDAAAPVATLAQARLPEAGQASTLLTVSTAGRFSLRVASARGVSLRLDDRMAGPGRVEGAAGRRDGRLDVLLDRGTYRLVTQGVAEATGMATVTVTPFVEQTSVPHRLASLRLTTERLSDFEQRSFWIELAERETVVVRAAGRYLADLRLWRDGEWLVDASPSRAVIERAVGQEIRRVDLSADLAPGRYRVTAYGGEVLEWAMTADLATEEDRLDVLLGVPTLAEAGRSRRVIGPFGNDVYVVPGGATYFRLELPSPAPAKLLVGRRQPNAPLRPAGASTAVIDRRAKVPVAEVRYRADPERPYLVSVEGAVGQSYVLQHFAEGTRTIEGAEGAYWISSVHAGDPRDSFQATGILVAASGQGRRQGQQVVTVGAAQGWAGRGNLVAQTLTFVEVEDAGRYAVLTEGVDTRVRVEPVLRERPSNYEPPPWQNPGTVNDLAAGLYGVSIEPTDANRVGQLDIVIRAADAVAPTFADVASASSRAPGAVTIGAVRLDAKERYAFILGSQGGVAAGSVVRRLPLDLRQSLPLALVPGIVQTLLIESEARGRLSVEVEGAEVEGAGQVSITIDGEARGTSDWIEAGRHVVEARNDGDATVWLSLGLSDASETAMASGSIPVSIPTPSAQPHLTVASPQAFSLARGADQTFRVEADAPGLYRLETTGLLATEGNLRTRVMTSLDRQRANGVGRNVLLQTYLRAGEYHFTVRALGASAGAVGARLAHASVRNGGRLRDGIPARGLLPAGAAVAYTFEVATKGMHALRALALGRALRVRLEDADGWPVVPPGGEGDLRLDLEPGSYRLIVLPADVDTRHLAMVERIPAPVTRTGHGPHALPFDQRIEHRWHEPEEGAPREPDDWRFTLPAPVTARIALSNEMQADLVRLDANEGEVVAGYVPPERGWQGTLAAGSYALRVSCTRVNNRVDYTLSLTPDEMFPGLERVLAVSSEVPLSIAEAGLVEIETFGVVDVRARLLDTEGREVARNDDRPGDWNALLAQRLDAGRYRLLVEAAGGASGEDGGEDSEVATTVTVRTPVTETVHRLDAPATREVVLADTVMLVPLRLPTDADTLRLAGRSAERVGVALEQRHEAGWITLAQRLGRAVDVILPTPPDLDGGSLRLRLWSLDRRGNPLTIEVDAFTAAPLSEADWVAGQGDRRAAAWAVQLDRPGCFRAEGAALVSTRSGRAAVPFEGVVAADGPTMWVVSKGERRARDGAPSGRRVAVRPGGEALDLTVEAGGRAVCDLETTSVGAPIVVEASSAAGAPGVALGRVGVPVDRAAGWALAGNRAVGVALPGERTASKRTVELWAREGDGTLEVRLIARPDLVRPTSATTAVATTAVATMMWGDHAATLGAGEARAFDLQTGTKHLRLVLDRGVVVALVDGNTDEVLSVHAAWDGRVDERLETTASRLWLLGGQEETSARVTIRPVSGETAVQPPTLGAPLVWQPPSAGRLRFAVPVANVPDRQLALEARGAEVSFLGDDGRIQHGQRILLPAAGGVATLRHGAGPVLVWVEHDDITSAGLSWGTTDAPAAPTSLPMAVTVDDTPRQWRATFETDALLHVRGAGPMVTEVRQAGRPSRVDVHPDRVELDAYVAAGDLHIGLRRLAAATDGVTIESTPVEPVAEGLGPPVLLAAGEARGFSFVVAEAGPVGVGVRADRDRVVSTLLDESGNVLGHGVIHLHDLTPGTYILLLSVDDNAPPVRARAAVVGLERPWTGPPAEVLRGYLEHADLTTHDDEQDLTEGDDR